jgi:hypothetical protein
MIGLVVMKPIIEEKPMSYEIKIHNNIAIPSARGLAPQPVQHK